MEPSRQCDVRPCAEREVVYKVASEEAEFDLISRLNYQTFVVEIPQHAPNPQHRLVDRFHHQNTYLIALAGGRLVGMMAVRDQRPFSLDEKLGPIDSLLPPHRRLCELRLLAVVPGHRNGRIFQGLIMLLMDYARQRHYDLAVICGSVRQAGLYRHLGFSPFGPAVGAAKARFQPMYFHLFGDCLRDLDLQRLRPHGAVVRVRPDGWSARVLGDDDGDCAVLVVPQQNGFDDGKPGRREHPFKPLTGAESSAVELALNLPVGRYAVQWLDPLTGRSLAADECSHEGGLATLVLPPFVGAIAGRLLRAGPLPSNSPSVHVP